MMTRRLLLFLLLTICPMLAFGSQSKIDSLSQILEKTTDDSTRCELYIAIALLQYTGEEAVSTGHKALDLARDMQNEILIGRAYNCLAWCYSLQWTDVKTAYLDSALAIFTKLNDADGLGMVYNTRAILLLDYGSMEEALGSLKSAYEYFGEAGNQHRQATVLNNWAVVLTDLNRLEEAIQKYDTALMYRLSEDPPNAVELGRIYFGMGRCAAMLGRPKEALNYYLESYRNRKRSVSKSVAETLIEISAMVCDWALAGNDTTALVRQMARSGIPNSMVPIQMAMEVLEASGPHQFGYSILDVRRKKALIDGDFEQAYALLAEQKKMDEEIKLSDSSLEALANLKSQYAQEQLKIQLLEEELENRKNETQVKFLLIFLGIMLLVLIIGLLVYQNRLKAKHLELTTFKQEQQFIAMRSMLEGQEKERARIARDLHDGLGNLLSTVKVTVGNLGLKSNGQSGTELFTSANNLIDEACREVRKISHEMMPQALEKLGLVRALEDLVQTADQAHGFNAAFNVYGREKSLDDATEMMLFRITQELLNNIIKYAEAKEVNVQLTYGEDWLNLTVEDDGVGFDTESVRAKEGMGLRSIAFRAAHIGGQYEIESRQGKGTMANISVPLKTNLKAADHD